MRKFLTVTLLALMLTVLGNSSLAQGLPVGEIVTVEGTADIISANAFRILAPTPIAPGTGQILVFPDTAAGFSIDINNGRSIEVVGELMEFDIITLESLLPYDLNNLALAGYGPEDYAVIATTVLDTTETILLDDSAVVDIETDPTLYFGDFVTTEGFAEILSPNVFRLLNTTPFDLAPGNVLVLPDTAAGFAIDVNSGMRLQVTGTLQAFNIAELEDIVGYELDDATLAAYDITDYAIIATSVVDLTEFVIYDELTITDFETDPNLFIEQTVTVEGVANIISSNAFEIVDTLPFSVSPSRIVVLPDTDLGFRIDINNGLPVTVTGTLIEFDRLELEARLRYALNDFALAEYGPSDYAIIATYVTTND